MAASEPCVELSMSAGGGVECAHFGTEQRCLCQAEEGALDVPRYGVPGDEMNDGGMFEYLWSRKC